MIQAGAKRKAPSRGHTYRDDSNGRESYDHLSSMTTKDHLRQFLEQYHIVGDISFQNIASVLIALEDYFHLHRSRACSVFRFRLGEIILVTAGNCKESFDQDLSFGIVCSLLNAVPYLTPDDKFKSINRRFRLLIQYLMLKAEVDLTNMQMQVRLASILRLRIGYIYMCICMNKSVSDG